MNNQVCEKFILNYLNNLNIKKEELYKRKTRENLEEQIWYYMQIIRQTANSKQIEKVVKDWISSQITNLSEGK